MGVRVFVSPSLVREIGVNRYLTVDAKNLGELLSIMDMQANGFKDSVCDEMGKIRVYVNIFVNGLNVNSCENPLVTRLQNGDRVHIFPSVAGGAVCSTVIQ